MSDNSKLAVLWTSDVGVEVIACKACAKMYGVSDKLSELGADVFYVGEAFTELLMTDWKVLSV